MKTQTPLVLKRAEQARRDQACAAALARANLQKKQAIETRKKGIPVDVLTRYFYLPQLAGCSIRNIDDFKSRSYALDRQVEDLIRHLYVRYPVPRYMLRSILTPEGAALLFREEIVRISKKKKPTDWKYRTWLLAAAQGESLAKVTKGVLTRKEAHWAAQAPADTFDEAIVWAKARTLNLPPAGLEWVKAYLALYARQEDVDVMIGFFAKHWDAMAPGQRRDILDFLSHEVGDIGRFLHGRGLRSVLQASDEWHRQSWQIKKYGHLKWKARFKDWSHENAKVRIEAKELCTIEDLVDEGTRMRHCVGTYAWECHQGRCAIFSLRFRWGMGLETRLTVEVAPELRSVVQVKGPRNARIDDNQKRGLMLWAAEMGFTFSPFAM